MREVFNWKNSNTSFGDVVAAMNIASRTGEANMERLDKYAKQHVDQTMINQEMDKNFNTGQMLEDMAAGREVDFSQPHDSLAYYKDAQQFANDKRDHDVAATKSNAMANYYEHQTKMNNMTDREKAKANLMKSIFSGSGKSKKSGGSKGKGGKTQSSAILKDMLTNRGFEDPGTLYGYDNEKFDEAIKFADIQFAGEPAKKRMFLESAGEVDTTGPDTYDFYDKAKWVKQAEMINQLSINKRLKDNAMEKIIKEKLSKENNVYLGY